ncbi:MAG: post-PEP-CTERM-1 domain-containing protein [Massilia sp.]
MTPHPSVLCRVLFAALALATGGALAQDAPAGMTAVRDPQTGQLRPATAAELRALGAAQLALRPAAAGAGPVKLRSDGRREVHLGEAALVQATVRRDADGKLTMDCVQGEDDHAHH